MVIEKLSKNRVLILIIVIAAAVFLGVYASSTPVRTLAADNTEDQPTKRTMNVVGQGTVSASPDIAYVTMGVVIEDKSAKNAQKANADTMSRVVSLLKAAGGIKNEDIKTVNYSICPKYDYNKDTGESKIIGYTVNNTIQVTVRDITKAGNIIDLGTDSGINISSNISFGLSDYESYYNQALKSAVEAAKKRADTIADTIGITLKLPVSISENGGYNPPMYNSDYAMKAEAASTPIQAGTVEVRAYVNITYEY